MKVRSRIGHLAAGLGVFGLAIAIPLAVPALLPVPVAAQSSAARCNDGQRRYLEIRNLSTRSLGYLKVRRAYSADQWSGDYLGSIYVPPGQSIIAPLPSENCQCSADLQVTFESDQGELNIVREYQGVEYCTYGNDSNRLQYVTD